MTDRTQHRRDLSWFVWRHVLVVTYLSALVGCADRRTSMSLPDPCDSPSPIADPVTIIAATPTGRIRELLDLNAASDGDVVGIAADSGLYIGALSRDSLVVSRRVTTWGREAAQLGGVAAITMTDSGELIVVDRGRPRIITFARNSAARSEVSVRDPAGIDEYVGGGGKIVAVTSRRADRPFDVTTGELFALDNAGQRGRRIAQFPSLALRVIGQQSGTKLMTRPFEHQPVVRWSERWGWIIGATDSLRLQFADGTPRAILTGGGRRRAIDRDLRDIGLAEYVRRTGASGVIAETIRRTAERSLFEQRVALQLVDAILPLPEGRLALRRMRLCRDLEGWSIVDSLGMAASGFTIPLSTVPVMSVRGGVLATEASGDSTRPVILRLFR